MRPADRRQGDLQQIHALAEQQIVKDPVDGVPPHHLFGIDSFRQEHNLEGFGHAGALCKLIATALQGRDS
jgi:hypothetical protein